MDRVVPYNGKDYPFYCKVSGVDPSGDRILGDAMGQGIRFLSYTEFSKNNYLISSSDLPKLVSLILPKLDPAHDKLILTSSSLTVLSSRKP